MNKNIYFNGVCVNGVFIFPTDLKSNNPGKSRGNDDLPVTQNRRINKKTITKRFRLFANRIDYPF